MGHSLHHESRSDLPTAQQQQLCSTSYRCAWRCAAALGNAKQRCKQGSTVD